MIQPVPFEYVPGFLLYPDEYFRTLWSELAWLRIDQVPRREYYCNRFPYPYTYGKNEGQRTYQPQPWHPTIIDIKQQVEWICGVDFEVCFLNGYENQRDQLGWHSDDSSEMDDRRCIAIVSLGFEREIWFRPKPTYEAKSAHENVTKQLLGNGSLCIMAPGMQDTHQHRIPKSHIQSAAPRLSLTFRGFI